MGDDTAEHIFYKMGNPPGNPTHTGDVGTGGTQRIGSNVGVVNSGPGVSSFKALCYKAGATDSPISSSGNYGSTVTPSSYLYGIGMLTPKNCEETKSDQGPGGFAGMDPYGWNHAEVTFVRGRYTWDYIEPSEGIYNWTGLDDLFARCLLYGKKASFGIAAGAATPSWVWGTGVIKYGPIHDHTAAGEFQPLPWDTVYQTKWFNLLNAVAARYANNSAFINYVIAGFMEEAGMYFGDSIDYGNAPQPVGFVPMSAFLNGPDWSYPDVGAAYLAGAKAVIDRTMIVFPTQKVVVTYVKPFATSPAPLTEIHPVTSSKLGGMVKDYIQGDDAGGAHPEYKTKGGFMVSSIFALDGFGIPVSPIQNGHGYPSGRQQYWLTTHTHTPPVAPERDVYKGGWPGPGPYPADPKPFNDMAGNCMASTGLFMEVYDADIGNPVLQPYFAAATAAMLAIVPP